MTLISRVQIPSVAGAREIGVRAGRLLLLLLVLAACARGTPYLEILDSAMRDRQTLAQEFRTTAAAYDAAHAARRITNTQYQPWRTYVALYQQRVPVIDSTLVTATVREQILAIQPEIIALTEQAKILRTRLDVILKEVPR